MDTVTLQVRRRTEKGSSAVRRLRAAGQVPGVVYGKSEPVEISVDALALRQVLHQGANVLIELSFEGQSGRGTRQYAVIAEVQRHPVKAKIMNVDLQRVDLREEIEAKVPVELVGESEGVKGGGILDQIVREVDVKAVPEKVPGVLQVDVSELVVGDHVTAGRLPTGPDYILLIEPDTIIATLLPPKLVVEPELEQAEVEEAKEEEKEGEESKESEESGD